MSVREIQIVDDELPTITLCMIAKNEETNLTNHLAKFIRAFDEVIITDTGSTDKTVAVAEALGAKVNFYQWDNDFSAARNTGLKEATKDYIMWMDADDEIDPQDIFTLKDFIANNPNLAYFLKLADVRADATLESAQLRVVPNHMGITFTSRIHEQLAKKVDELQLPYAARPVAVVHYGYSDPSVFRSKLERNLEILTEELLETPDSLTVNVDVAKTAGALGNIGLGLECINKAIAIAEADNLENDQYLLHMYVTKMEFIVASGDADVLFKYGEDMLNKFPEDKIAYLLVGEIFFRLGEYARAYETFSFIKDFNLPVTIFPIDMARAKNSLANFLAISSLTVGDFDTAETLLKRILEDNKFTIKR